VSDTIVTGGAASGSMPDGALRFGPFELDVRTGELRREGATLRLQHQPARVLCLLAGRAGELVTREEIRRAVWGDDTFVDFDQGLNFCVKEIRSALDDDAENPRYVETLRGRGYRFVAPVERASPAEPPGAARATASAPRPLPLLAALLAALAALATLAAWQARRHRVQATGGRVLLLVLPFQDLGGETEREFFGDGLTEEMIAQLGRLHPERLGVIGRTSAMRYRGRDRDVAAVARELGVDYVVEGTVRHAAGRVRITAQLVKANDRTQLWAETYDRRLADVLRVQGEVARAIAREIQLTLTPQMAARLEGAEATDPEAYELYLRGRHAWNLRDQAGLTRAISYFERVIARRPDFALAWVGIADAYVVLADHGYLAPGDAMPKARAAAERALAIDPSRAEAQSSLAMVKAAYEWDWAGAEAAFRRAIDLNPSYPTSHHWYAHLLRALGRFDEAVAEMGRARDIDPHSLIISGNLGSALFYAGRHREAAEQYRRTLALDAAFVPGHWGLSRALLPLGRREEAVAAAERAVDLSGGDATYLAHLAWLYSAGGQPQRARALLERMRALAAQRYVSAYDMALVHAGLGDAEAAFAALEGAYAVRETGLRQLRVDERLAGVRGDVRFEELARRIGLHPWPTTAAAAGARTSRSEPRT
jgi:TolB-like protein/DNA-binding winged helix-turn-helix (wHTH) protein/Tfp pilus assembly protein PilF